MVGAGAEIMAKQIPLKTAQRRLALAWIIGAGATLVVALIRSIQDYYKEIDILWNWLLPTVVPTLTLVVGTITELRQSRRTVDRFVYSFAMGASVVYLTIVFALLVFVATPSVGVTPSYLQSRTGAVLAIFQGIASISIGRFFVKTED
jgi:hypothetical protein